MSKDTIPAPSSHGIVVDHREAKNRYAISDKNFNPATHKYVRDLRPGESVLSYVPRAVKRLGEAEPVEQTDEELAELEVVGTHNPDDEDLDEELDIFGDEDSDQTEGSSAEGTSEAN